MLGTAARPRSGSLGTIDPFRLGFARTRLEATAEVVLMAGTHAPIPLERRHVSPFWRHFLEMLAVMAVGMIATGAIFLAIVGLNTWEEVTTQYATQSLLAMAAGMTVPMVAWMMYRGMGWRNSSEMAGAMIVPVIPFLFLVWFGVTESAQCGWYCALTFVTMYALMRYRRSGYST